MSNAISLNDPYGKRLHGVEETYLPENTTDTPGDMDIEEADDEDTYPMLPWCDSTDDEFGSRWVDYSDRGPRDVVLSGPVIGGYGPGRWHKNRRIAYWRLVGKFGADRIKQMRQSQGRWSFLVKNLKAA